MKKALATSTILAVFLLVTSNAHAQLESFQKLYLTEHFTTCFDVVPTPDQGYLITGFEDRPAPFMMPLVPYLAKIDCRGEMEWMKKYGVTTMIDNTDPRVAMLDQGDYIMMSTVQEASYDILVTRTTPDGETVWQNLYGGPAKDVGRGLLKTADDNIIVMGSTQSYGSDTDTPYSDMYAVKINSANGDTLWTQAWGNTLGIDDLWAAAEDESGNLTFVGRSFYDEGIWLSVIRTTSAGKILWSKVFGKTNHHAQAFDIQITDEGDYVITGMTTLAKVDFTSFVDVPVIRMAADGKITWAKVLHGTNPDLGEVGSSLVIRDGVIAVALETTSYPTSQSDITKRLLYRLDATTGDLLYATMFNSPGGQFPMIREDGEGYIMSGFTDEFPGSWNDPILTKLDANFDSGCNETELTSQTATETPEWVEAEIDYSNDRGSAITEYLVDSTGTFYRDSTFCFTGTVPTECTVMSSTEEQSSALAFSVFPNPGSGKFTLELKEWDTNINLLEVYNLQGQLILSLNKLNKAIIPLDLRDQPAGLYLIRLQTGDRAFTRLVEKL